MDGDDGASAVLFAMDGDFGPRNGLFQPPSQTSAQVREKGRLVPIVIGRWVLRHYEAHILDAFLGILICA
jgi:hypothetical protein